VEGEASSAGKRQELIQSETSVRGLSIVFVSIFYAEIIQTDKEISVSRRRGWRPVGPW
jgi:hypothetical protein